MENKVLSIKKDFFRGKQSPIKDLNLFTESINSLEYVDLDSETYIPISVSVSLRSVSGKVVVFNTNITKRGNEQHNIMLITPPLSKDNNNMSNDDKIVFATFLLLRDFCENNVEPKNTSLSRLQQHMLKSQLNYLGLFHFRTDCVNPLYHIEVVLQDNDFDTMVDDLGFHTLELSNIKSGKANVIIPKSILERMNFKEL